MDNELSHDNHNDIDAIKYEFMLLKLYCKCYNTATVDNKCAYGITQMVECSAK